MRRFLAALLLGGLTLTGCGGSETATTPASTSAPSTIRTATVGQIASVVSKHSADLRKYAASARVCATFDSPGCDAVAKVSGQTLAISASTLDIELRAAAEDRPNNKLFIGAYPAELVRLVAATRAAIAELGAASEAATKAGCAASPTPAACAVPLLQLGDGADHLVQQLDAWSPYIH